MINKYRKKPIEIQAILWDGTNFDEIKKFCPKIVNSKYILGCIIIPTLEGEMSAKIGVYIIKGIVDEFYACDGFVFEQTYELVIK